MEEKKSDCNSNIRHCFYCLANAAIYGHTFKWQVQPAMQRWRFKDRSRGSDSCGQICTLKASALLRTHFLLQPFCLRNAHPHQSKDLRDNKPSSLPYFFFSPLHLEGNLLTRTGKVAFSLAGPPPHPHPPSFFQGSFKGREDHPERLTYSSSTAGILFSFVGSLGLELHHRRILPARGRLWG